VLGNSCRLDDTAPFGYILGHLVAHFFGRTPAGFKSKPQHPLADVGRSPDLGAEHGDDFGGLAAGIRVFLAERRQSWP